MASLLENLGTKLAGAFGEPNQGVSAHTDQESGFSLSESTLAGALRIQGYDPELGLFYSKSSRGFVIESLPLVGIEDSVEKEVMGYFQEVMQEGSSLQFLLIADHRVAPFFSSWQQARNEEIYRHVCERRCDFLKNHYPSGIRNYRLVVSYSVPNGEHTDSSIQAIRDNLLKSLQSHTWARTWDAEDFLTQVGSLLNFDFSREVSKRRWNRYELLSEQLPQGGVLQVEEDRISWDKRADFRSYRAVDYPDQWSLGGMQALIGDLFSDSYRIDTPFVIQYAVHLPNQEKAQAAFKRKMLLTENQGKSGWLIRMVPRLAGELNECDYIRRNLDKGERIVWTQLGVGIWSEPGKLNEHDQLLKSLYRNNQFVLAENRMTHLPHFLSFLPMSWSEYVGDLKRLNLTKTTLTSEASNLVPIQGEWGGSSSPGVLLVGRRGQVLNWNPFDNNAGNYNVVVVGRSGSGKSVFMQELLMSSLGTGAKVFIFDVGRSFEKMCALLNGQLIEFGHNQQLCLNPFTNISIDNEEERSASLGMLKSVVATMAAPNEGTSDLENALIEKAIRVAWETKRNKATISDVAHHLLSDDDARAQTIGKMLTPYMDGGVYAKYFNGECNVDFRKSLVLVELEELKEKKDLQGVIMQLFIMEITNQTFLGDRKQPFHICIDEAWDLLRGKQTGVFIETLARRLRKYNGSLVVGTQSVDDFYANDGALAAFQNSDWMCLLSQKKSSIQRLAESNRLDLEGGKRYALESVSTRHGEYSEIMICDGEGSFSIGRLILDPFSGLLYSTKADEYALVKDRQKQGMSVVEAIESILEEKRNA